MIIDVDPRDARPIYRQIVDEIQRSIAIGVLKSEDALPAVRRLAAELKVNANTVQQAYRTLVTDGDAYVKRGEGTFVARRDRTHENASARQIAERALREAFRHGLLASDLIEAIRAIAPRPAGER